jgi:hypothetical protein
MPTRCAPALKVTISTAFDLWYSANSAAIAAQRSTEIGSHRYVHLQFHEMSACQRSGLAHSFTLSFLRDLTTVYVETQGSG